MRRTLIGILMFTVAFTFSFTGAFAQPPDKTNQPSAKVTAQCREICTFSNWEDEPSVIFMQTIKTPDAKDLFINVSLLCGVKTDTMVSSWWLGLDESSSNAMVKVRVWVDDKMADPGEVIFSHRRQDLAAEFAGDISQALYFDPSTGTIKIDESKVQPETLQLVLDTMTANSFGFIAQDISSGVHTIKVEAYLDGDASNSEAYVGKGSITVESVRLIKDEDVVI